MSQLYNNLTKIVDPKLAEAISDFVVKHKLGFFGYFLQNVNFYRTEFVKTAGVNFKDLKMNFYYNKKFVDGLNKNQVKFLCLHELFHLLFNHPKRGRGYNRKLANICMDMIINEIILKKYCIDLPISDREIKPKVAEFIPGCVLMDSHYEGERIFELLYTWLNGRYTAWETRFGDEQKEKTIADALGETPSDGEGCGCPADLGAPDISEQRKKENEELGIDDYTRQFFEGSQHEFDEHFWDDISDEIKQQIVDRMMKDLKGRGIMPGENEDVIGKLIKKKDNSILKLLKRNVSQIKGFSKTPTHRKPSKKGLEGLKGRIKFSDCINCILDTSGSMSGSFELVLSEIFKDDFRINLIQCDAAIEKVMTITNKNQLSKMKIKGLGGTTLQPGIDFVTSHKDYRKSNLVILTDGYTDTLDFSKCGAMKVLIISAGKDCPMKKSYKNVSHVLVKK